MTGDFDPEALHRLVDGALGETPASPQHLVLGPTDTRLFEAFDKALANRLPVGEIQMVFDEVRSVLTQGVETTPQRLATQVSLCRACPGAVAPPAAGRWNLTDPDVLVVLETPDMGAEAADALIDALKEAGFNSRRLGLTYATRCRAGQAATCSDYLVAEITLLAPKLIVPVGAEVSQFFVGDAKITEVHGQLFWLGPWAVLPCTNPLYALRSGATEALVGDLRKAHRFVYGTGAVERGAPAIPGGALQVGSSSHTAQSSHVGAL